MTTRLTPDTIEDRYDGLMFGIADMREDARTTANYAVDMSELWDRLDDALREVVFGLVRHDLEAAVDPIVEDLHGVIRDRAVDLAYQDASKRRGAAA